MDSEVETKYTLEEYKRYNKSVMNVFHKERTKLQISFILICVSFALLIWMGEYKYAALWILFWVVLIGILWFRYNQNIKKAWETNTVLKDAVNRYHFMEEQIEIISAIGNSVLEYDKIYRLIETDTNFYIMIANNQGYIINKNYCTPPQQDWIQQRCTTGALRNACSGLQ